MVEVTLPNSRPIGKCQLEDPFAGKCFFSDTKRVGGEACCSGPWAILEGQEEPVRGCQTRRRDSRNTAVEPDQRPPGGSAQRISARTVLGLLRLRSQDGKVPCRWIFQRKPVLLPRGQNRIHFPHLLLYQVRQWPHLPLPLCACA